MPTTKPRFVVIANPTSVKMMQSVLFDFNGVLVDDEHIHRDAFNEVLAPLGITMSQAAYDERYLGFDDRGAFEAVLRDHTHPVTETLVQQLIADKAVVYMQRARHDLRIFPGAPELVRACASVARVAIVSGALRAEIENALELMGVRACVDFIIAAEDVARCKPDPEGYLAACARLEHGARGAVVIEDSLAGIESAQSAQLPVLAVAHSYPREALERLKPNAIVDVLANVSVEQLAAIVRD